MDEVARTILVAASNILHDEGVERVRDAVTLEDRECANSALLASVMIQQFLKAAS